VTRPAEARGDTVASRGAAEPAKPFGQDISTALVGEKLLPPQLANWGTVTALG